MHPASGFGNVWSKFVMNLQGFPRDFLLKLKPEAEEAAAGLPPRSADEAGVGEIVIRVKLSAGGAR
jgi:hypothetical protein